MLLWIISHFSHRILIRISILSFITLFIVAQGHATYVRNIIWRTQESIWLDGIGKYPDYFRPYLNLGSYYLKQGLRDKALYFLTEALSKRYPVGTGDKHLTYYNLGVAYQLKGNKDKAFQCYLEAEKIYPTAGSSHPLKFYFRNQRFAR